MYMHMHAYAYALFMFRVVCCLACATGRVAQAKQRCRKARPAPQCTHRCAWYRGDRSLHRLSFANLPLGFASPVPDLVPEERARVLCFEACDTNSAAPDIV